MTTRSDSVLWQDLDAAQFTWQIPDRLNIARACLDDQRADDVALIVDDGGTETRFTFGELTCLSRRFAGFLAARGVGAGDRVGVMVPQGVEVVTAHLGSFRAGRGDGAAVGEVRSGGGRLPVAAFGCPTAGDRRRELRPGPPGAGGRGDAAHGARGGRRPGRRGRPRQSAHLRRSPSRNGIRGHRRHHRRLPRHHHLHVGHHRPAKGALHAHRILPAHMPGVRTAFANAPQPGDVFWTPADWAWIGGLFDVVFTAMALGRPVVATPGRLTPAETVAVLRRHRVSATFMPPTALKQLRSAGITAADAQGLALRIVATGGESLGTALRDWIEATLATVVNEFYGQTEINMVLGTAVDSLPPEPDSMGRAFPGFEVAVLDPEGVPVGAGEVGEICVRAGNPGQFLRYWQQPEATADKVRDGWIHTGDQARRDAAGNFSYQGRADDIISSAGYRVGPGEIEECLLSHPAVAMAAAVGVPDSLRGEAIHAFVVLTEGHSPATELADELRQHVKSRLAFYQYPREITFRTELPLTTTGKIMRRELRDGLAGESRP